jgi:hypothetical protein
MVEPFEIFRVCGGDQPLWLESAIALDRAKARVEELGIRNPGEYLIYCDGSGDQISIITAGGGQEKGDRSSR